jgi:hypothetical protein
MARKIICLEIQDQIRFEAIRAMKQEHGWSVLYWTGSGDILSQVNSCFPEATLHDSYDAVRNIPPVSPVVEGSEIDDHVMQRLIDYRDMFFRIIHRVDPEARMNAEERQSYYVDLAAYWTSLFLKLRPDLLIFNSIPHLPHDYLAYAISKIMSIDRLCFMHTAFDNTFIPTSSFEDESPIERSYKDQSKRDNKNFISLESKIQSVVDGMAAPAGQTLPSPGGVVFSRIKKAEQTRGLLNIPRKWIGELFWISYFAIVNRRATNRRYMKLSREPLSKTADCPMHVYLKYKRRSRIKKTRLAKLYKRNTDEPELNRSYVYFPLHYQPECQTAPLAGRFDDQFLIIETLLQCLPDGWVIYVKENPAQLLDRLYGDASRSEEFYRRLIDLDRVTLVSAAASTFDLIDHSECVVTATGTVGIEAVLRNKTAFFFGYAWYQGCEGTYRIRSVHECRKAFDQVSSGVKIDKERVLLFLFALQQNAVKLQVTPKRGGSLGFQEKMAMIRDVKELLILHS